ncbi:MAG TPA: O-antigen ligase family protein [Anaerolineales bacterium]|nr:O-antigen ligase family protein [Anaerolineales bacterium]
MNITKNDLFYILMSIAVASIGVVAVNNLHTQLGLYSLLGLLGIMIVFAIIIKPSLGANILVLAIFTNVSDLLTKQGYAGLTQPLVIIVALALFIRYLYAGEKPVSHFQTFRIEFFLLFYFVVVAASVIVAGDQNRALTDVFDLGKDIVIVYCILFALRQPAQWKQTVWLIIIITTALAGLSAYQFITNNYQQTFMDLASVVMARVDGENLTARAGGPVNAPNVWAQILVAVSMLLIFRIMQAKQPLARLVMVAMLGIMLYAVLNTYSRAAIVVLVIDIVIVMLVLKRHVNPFIAVAALAVLVVIYQFLPASYQNRISTLSFVTSESGIYEDSSFRGRSSEMLTGLAMFAEHPILGVGTANYRPNYQRYAQVVGLEFRAEERDAHSLYVQVVAETGVLGAIAFFGLILTLLSALNRACLDIQNSPRLQSWLPWMNAIRMAIMSYLLTSFFLHNAYFRYFWILFAMALAGIHITYGLLNNPDRNQSLEARL